MHSIFDAEEGRALVPDLHLSPPVRALIAELEQQGDERTLRRFALACAELITGGVSEAEAALLVAARAAVEGHAVDLEVVRGQYTGTAMAATTVGLRRGAANAASFLAAFEATAPDAALAARGAARMEVLHARMRGAPEDGVSARQVAWLEEALN